ncbi:hypothetical protein JHJ32_21555 [Parapedobacter sp. ISTM3]|uniref:hypothetical protein n=1 Tax=Parapedobacter sp. ISTM3 TaxID=2800130 RepID=UPI001903EA04|nr:hypothetical protein [Parapedobacter sp. ISTM3]MBK1442601.1 hypothetical protein [Parapedobacter sp. ISTM3]
MGRILKPLFALYVLMGGLSTTKAQTTLHGSYKAVTIALDQNVPYSRSLILLHEMYNGALLPNNYAVGTIMAIRGAANAYQRLNVVDIRSSSAYNTTAAALTSNDGDAYGATATWALKTCMYNGKKYLALQVPYLGGQHSGGYHFVGWIQSSGESLKAVTYDVNGVPQNQNILTNIADYTPNMAEHHLAGRLLVNGNVGIGTTNPQAKLAVNGNILAKEVKVKTDISVPDYVFAPEYELPALADVEAYVKEHRHLPEIPSAKDIERDGLDLAEMNLLLLKKVEELTLHLIEKHHENRQLRERLTNVEQQISELITNQKSQKP